MLCRRVGIESIPNGVSSGSEIDGVGHIRRHSDAGWRMSSLEKDLTPAARTQTNGKRPQRNHELTREWGWALLRSARTSVFV